MSFGGPGGLGGGTGLAGAVGRGGGVSGRTFFGGLRPKGRGVGGEGLGKIKRISRGRNELASGTTCKPRVVW